VRVTGKIQTVLRNVFCPDHHHRNKCAGASGMPAGAARKRRLAGVGDRWESGLVAQSVAQRPSEAAGRVGVSCSTRLPVDRRVFSPKEKENRVPPLAPTLCVRVCV